MLAFYFYHITLLFIEHITNWILTVAICMRDNKYKLKRKVERSQKAVIL